MIQLVASVAMPAGATRSSSPKATVLSGATTIPAIAISTASPATESTKANGTSSTASIASRRV